MLRVLRVYAEWFRAMGRLLRAVWLRDRGEPAAALPLLMAAAPVLAKWVQFPGIYGNCQMHYAQCLLELDRPGEALPHFEDALRLLQAAESEARYGECRFGQANCLLVLGNHAEALLGFEEAAPLLKSHGSREDYAACRMNQAGCLRALHRPEDALPFWSEAAQLLDPRGARMYLAIRLVNYANCRMNEAVCLVDLDRPTEALPHYEEAAILLEGHGSRADYAVCRMNQAICLRALGKYGEALRCYEEAAPLLEANGSRAEFANCRMNQAVCLKEIGRAAEALPLCEEAAGLLATHGSRAELASCLMNQATCLQDVGRPREALPLYEEAAPLLDRHGSRARFATCLMNQATCLQDVGRHEEALALFDEAAVLLNTYGSPADYADCRMNQAIGLKNLDRLDEAGPRFEESAALLAVHGSQVHLASCRLNQANCVRRMGRTAEALDLYEEVLRICDRVGESGADARWRGLFNRAVLQFGLGDPAAARSSLADALPVVERLAGAAPRLSDRLGLREMHVDIYRLATQLALSAHDMETAFAHAQRAKSRLLLDLVEHRARLAPSDRRLHEIDALREQEFQLMVEAQGADSTDDTRAAHLLEDLRLSRVQLRAQLPPEEALISGPARSLAEIQGGLWPGEALLDFLHLIAGSMAVFVVTRDTCVARLLDSDSIRVAVEAYAADVIADDGSLAVAHGGRYRPPLALAHLHALLIAPLEADGLLRPGQDLVIAPSGILHRVPFAALWHTVAREPRYLYEDYRLSLTPSASSLWTLRQREPLVGPPTLLAFAPFADPAAIPTNAAGPSHTRAVAERGIPSECPHTGREVSAVAEAVRLANPAAGAVVELIGTVATRAEVLEQTIGVRLLLASTHGSELRDEESVLDYRLLFAPEHDEVPTVSVLDVYEGRLPLAGAFEVAATACHLGKVVEHGEEALGFIQGFLSAGARIALAPLWAVDDVATAELSIAYHWALLSPERPSAAAAMRVAMSHVRAEGSRPTTDTAEAHPEWQHPFFWAAMLPAGDAAQHLP